MVSVTLAISATDASGKKKETNITNINPEKSNADLKEFAIKLTALTKNNYAGAQKITKEDITGA